MINANEHEENDDYRYCYFVCLVLLGSVPFLLSMRCWRNELLYQILSFYRFSVKIEKQSLFLDLCWQVSPSVFGSYTYDAVWAYAKSIDALYAENPAYLKFLHTPYAAQ